VSAETNAATIAFADPDAWEAWLAEHHASSKGLWLKLAKKSSGIRTVSHDTALEVALCYGWIDGQAKPFDDAYWLQRFTPRTRRSRWSKINRENAAQLIKNGKMKAPGLEEVKRAKADGRWEAAYEGQRVATVPPDLQRELNKSARARKFFASLNSQNRYAILYRIQDAKKPETRKQRVEKFVGMLKEGRKIYP
jgi:uncharacterized protein YdeI (YjbR/CyaY-like superfamily)